MSDPNFQSPVNPLPPVVIVLFLMITAVELVLSAASSGFVGGPAGIGWRLEAIRDYALFDRVLAWMLENRQIPLEHLLRFVTFPFVHGSFTQAAFAAVMLLAMGKFVGEVFSGAALLALFFLSSLTGGLIYCAILSDAPPLFGAFPGVYGLIGAFTFVLWARLARQGQDTKQAFSLIGFLLAIQLVFGLLFGGGPSWIADIAGFAAGFALSVFLARGGFPALIARMRRQ